LGRGRIRPFSHFKIQQSQINNRQFFPSNRRTKQFPIQDPCKNPPCPNTAYHQSVLSNRRVRAMLPHAMAEKTLFEKIRDREIPASLVHEDDHCIAFRDISPQAPVHVLVVPKKPIPRVGLAALEDQQVLGHLLLTAAAVARSEGLAESGYRLVINNGRDGGEAVPHLHVHLLGGRKLDWPPG
jgi:histidine triad (HIT) family protein